MIAAVTASGKLNAVLNAANFFKSDSSLVRMRTVLQQ